MTRHAPAPFADPTPRVQPHNWHQYDLRIDDPSQQVPPLYRGPLQSASRAVAQAFGANAVWHMRKAPGLRLRVAGDAAAVRQILAPYLQDWQRQDWICGWNEADYDPEWFYFGGAAGLALHHRIQAADSAAVLDYIAARLRGRGQISPADFSLLCCRVLIERFVGDRDEAWDAVCRLGDLRRLSPRDIWQGAFPARDDTARAQLKTLAQPLTLPPQASEDEIVLIGRLERRFSTCATAAMQLTWPPRMLVSRWIVSHWNRMGFDLNTQKELAGLMVQAWHPHMRYAAN